MDLGDAPVEQVAAATADQLNIATPVHEGGILNARVGNAGKRTHLVLDPSLVFQAGHEVEQLAQVHERAVLPHANDIPDPIDPHPQSVHVARQNGDGIDVPVRRREGGVRDRCVVEQRTRGGVGAERHVDQVAGIEPVDVFHAAQDEPCRMKRQCHQPASSGSEVPGEFVRVDVDGVEPPIFLVSVSLLGEVAGHPELPVLVGLFRSDSLFAARRTVAPLVHTVGMLPRVEYFTRMREQRQGVVPELRNMLDDAGSGQLHEVTALQSCVNGVHDRCGHVEGSVVVVPCGFLGCEIGADRQVHHRNRVCKHVDPPVSGNRFVSQYDFTRNK
jgi:hypothetical protein